MPKPLEVPTTPAFSSTICFQALIYHPPGDPVFVITIRNFSAMQMSHQTVHLQTPSIMVAKFFLHLRTVPFAEWSAQECDSKKKKKKRVWLKNRLLFCLLFVHVLTCTWLSSHFTKSCCPSDNSSFSCPCTRWSACLDLSSLAQTSQSIASISHSPLALAPSLLVLLPCKPSLASEHGCKTSYDEKTKTSYDSED